MIDTILLYILFFFFYSNAGWFFESLYCSIAAKKWINRGFLTGPLCPIYGAGALVLAVFLSPVKDKWYLVFFLGIILCDIVEFITSLILEKLFNARWWDYSHKFMNIQGRICLQHSIIWGFASLLFVRLMHPFFSESFELIPPLYRNILLSIILVVFFIDLAGAVAAAADIRKLNQKLHAFKLSFMKVADTMRSGVENATASVQKSISRQGRKSSEIKQEFDDIQSQFEQIKKGEDKKNSKTARMLRASKNLRQTILDRFKAIEDYLNDLMKNDK